MSHNGSLNILALIRLQAFGYLNALFYCKQELWFILKPHVQCDVELSQKIKLGGGGVSADLVYGPLLTTGYDISIKKIQIKQR